MVRVDRVMISIHTERSVRRYDMGMVGVLGHGVALEGVLVYMQSLNSFAFLFPDAQSLQYCSLSRILSMLTFQQTFHAHFPADVPYSLDRFLYSSGANERKAKPITSPSTNHAL